MVFVAKEMERRQIRLPLLIGGATTSQQHTAVKIAPEYGHTTVHVLDASRVVDVVVQLMSNKRRQDFARENAAVKSGCGNSMPRAAEKPLMAYEAARGNRPRRSTGPVPPAVPRVLGRRVLNDVPLEELFPYIDWTFFFAAWELKGRFPAILEHPQYGSAARDLYDARRMFSIASCSERCSWRAAYTGSGRQRATARTWFFTPIEKVAARSSDSTCCDSRSCADGRPNLSLADFVAPRRSHRAARDYIGAFAVTAGIGAERAGQRVSRRRTTTTARSS